MAPQPLLIKPSTHRSHYRILGQIGQGQFGKVYCALHRQSGKLYALKDLEHKVFPTNKFLRELTYLVTLRHPNIVTCYAIEYHSRGRYLVMDYCEGGTLRDLMDNEGQVNLVEKLNLIVDVLAGLEHAHRSQIIHCDIKPENILLKLTATGWKAKISDFGIAQLTEITGNPNFGRGYTGSPAYMAPERFYGKFSVTSDLYAVGILLYELILGYRPFTGLPGQIQSAHLNQRVPIPESFPELIRPILSKSLEKLPQKRFSDAGAMKDALQKVIQTLKTEDPRAFFQVADRPLRYHSFSQIAAETVTSPVHHLSVFQERVYISLNQQLLCRTYKDKELNGDRINQWEIDLSDPIVALHTYEQGAFAVTRSSLKITNSGKFTYHLYQFPQNTSPQPVEQKPLGTWQVSKLACCFDPLSNWLGLVTPRPDKESRGSFQLLKLPQLQPASVAHNSLFPSQLITVDHAHGLAVFLAQTKSRQATVFRLFNRRGDIFSAFTLPILLTVLTLNTKTHNHLFGLELNHKNIGILIRLRPLKVIRIALNLEPAFILSYPWGYLLADHHGNCHLLDADGYHIGEFNLNEKITAIAAVGETRCLVATWSGKQGNIKLIDLGSNIQQVIDQLFDNRK